MFKSTDGGASWRASSSGTWADRSFTALALDPSNSATLYVGTSSSLGTFAGVYKSTDGGASWQDSSSGLGGSYVSDFAFDPSKPGTLYASGSADGRHGSGDGVFKSTDGGVNWQDSSGGLTNSHVTALALDPGNPATLYAGTLGGGVFKLRLSPTIASINPSSGAAGSVVEILGSGFGTSQGSGRVTLGSAQAAVASWTDSKIAATAPAKLSGAVAVVVTAAARPSNSMSFSYGGAPSLGFEPAALDFGRVRVGTSGERSVTLTNIAGGTLSGTISAPAPYEIIAGSRFSLGAGESKRVTVRFSPAQKGTFAGQASIESNGGNASITLAGSAQRQAGRRRTSHRHPVCGANNGHADECHRHLLAKVRFR